MLVVGPVAIAGRFGAAPHAGWFTLALAIAALTLLAAAAFWRLMPRLYRGAGAVYRVHSVGALLGSAAAVVIAALVQVLG